MTIDLIVRRLRTLNFKLIVFIQVNHIKIKKQAIFTHFK